MATVGTKTRKATQLRKDETLGAVQGLTLGNVADQLAKTQVEVQKRLADVGTQVTSQLAILENVNGAILIKKEELKGLHDIDAAAIALDDLKAEIQATREAWAREQQAQQVVDTETAAMRAKERQREEAEYQYRTQQTRLKETDTYTQQQATARRQEAERKADLEKSWAQREAELKAREQELVDLRQQVAKFPDTIKTEVSRAEAILSNVLKRNYEVEKTLLLKDSETAAKLANQEVAASKLEVTRLTQVATELRQQLTEAHKSAQDTAARALESAAGRQALETLQHSLNRGDGAAASVRR